MRNFKGGGVIRVGEKSAYGFIFPALAVMIFAVVLVNFYNVYLSFTNWGPGHNPDYDLIGLRNYSEIFHGGFAPHFLRVFTWNVIFAASTVVISFFFGLFLACILNNPRLRARNLYRTFLIIPWALPATMTILAWRGILGTSTDTALAAALTTPLSAKLSVLLVNIWTAFPFMMCAALGSLQSIPPAVYEAAAIDGAGRWRRFRHITLPLLRSAMLPVIIFTFAFHFNNFTAVMMLSEGGPATAVDPSVPGGSDIMITYAYKLAFWGGNFNYSMAAAFSVIIFMILAVLTFLNFRITGVLKEAVR